MDHFAGFDRLLRVCLQRAGPLHLTGPMGFADRVAAKLGSYTWNLLDAESADFAIVVDEFDGRVRSRSQFRAHDAFARRDLGVPALRTGLGLDGDEFSVEAVVLDHGIPCLAFALQERLRVNVWREGLDRLGLPVGPWLNEAKRAARRHDADDTVIAVDAARTITL